MANKKEPVAWITVKGVRVPIFEGQSKEDAFKSFKERIGKRNSNQPMTQKGKADAKKEYTNARNAAHNAKPDKQEKAGERFEKAKQKYSESKQKTAIKSTEFTRPSDRDSANKTDNEFMKRENERYEKEHGKGTYQKEETQKQQRTEQARKALRDNNVNKDLDEKERQIARSRAEADERNGKNEHYDTVLNDIRGKLDRGELTPEQARNKAFEYEKSQRGNKQWTDVDKNRMQSKVRDIFDGANKREQESNKESDMSKEEAMLNYKAIKISKHMPIAKQEELKRLKAQYLKIWKG